MKFGELLRSNTEQYACYEKAFSSPPLVVEALAGTGKTTVVKMIAADYALLGKRVLYLAFNRAIVKETRNDAKGAYECRTAHGLAFLNVGSDVVNKFEKTKDVFLLDRDLMKLLGIDSRLQCPDVQINEVEFGDDLELELSTKKERASGTPINIRQIRGSVLLDSVIYLFTLFRKSVDVELSRDFVVTHLKDSMEWPWSEAGFAESRTVIDYVWEKSLDYWNRVTDLGDFVFPLDHDSYLKMWQISQPVLDFDVIIFDEAQDADPVMVNIIENQSAIKLWVGDTQQQIYAWRGAVNTLSVVEAASEGLITVTQRFGSPIDAIANAFLTPLGSQSIKPNPDIQSSVECRNQINDVEDGQTGPVELELFRTNLSLLNRFISLTNKGVNVRVLADLELLNLRLEGLLDIARGDPPEFSAFAHFVDFQDMVIYVNRQLIRAQKNPYASQPNWFPDVLLLLRHVLATSYGLLEYRPADEQMIIQWEKLGDAIEQANKASGPADCTLATAHKAKGLTCDEVWVHASFCENSLYDSPQSVAEAVNRVKEIYASESKAAIAKFEEEQRLCYVAVTRARRRLIHHFPITDYLNISESKIESATEVHEIKEEKSTVESDSELSIKSKEGESDLGEPGWSSELCRLLEQSESKVSPPVQMNFRIRFSGWTNLGGKLESFGFDVITNKLNRPTKLNNESGPNELLQLVQRFLNLQPPIVADLPTLTLAAERMLESARTACHDNEIVLRWENGPHQWQVSLWDELNPDDVIRLYFGKRGLNLDHLAGSEGDQERCSNLMTFIREGISQ
jgi:hypothetical protein